MKKKVTIESFIRKVSSKKVFLLVTSFFLFVTVLTTFFKSYGDFVSNLTRENSGINGDTVYVNDAESDWYYYTSLNYASNSSNTIPTLVDKNLYNKNNLVEINITYNGNDPVSNLTGRVSNTENQTKYLYYKVLPVNNNGTSGNMTDDYVLVELIDNPFALRPNDFGFNGWITTYRGVSIYLDTVYYVRYAKVPVTYNNGVPNPIEITFNAKWINGKTIRSSDYNSWNDVYGALDSNGFVLMGSETPIYDDCSQYTLYTRGSVSGNYWWGTNYPSGALNEYGQSLDGQTCYSYTCYYYTLFNGNCNNAGTYYRLVNGRMTQYTAQIIGYDIDPGVPENSNIAGYYKQVNVSRNATTTDVYDSSGNYLPSVTCNTNGGCTYYRLQGYYNGSNDPNLTDGTRTLYYKVTRDTNVILLDENVTNIGTPSKPFTMTSLYGGTAHNYQINLNNNYIQCQGDTRIEYLQISGGTGKSTDDVVVTGNNNRRRIIYGNFFNLKIGRGITQNGSYVNANTVSGAGYSTSTQGSSSNPKKFRLVVESGVYNFISASMGSLTSNGTRPTIYMAGETIVGNDYDRVKKDNDKLEVYENYNGTLGGSYVEDNARDYLFSNTLKSGKIGTSRDAYSTGIYVGGRGYQSDKINGMVRIKIEGGWAFNVIGGPLIDSGLQSRNVVDVTMTGGSVEAIFGGAGDAATYGNRIIKVLGGTVEYSVFGGSNGYQSNEGAGTLNGTTYLYIGGTATIGTADNIEDENKKYGFESGSVFGIGNGKTGSSTIGSCDNSNIIVNDKAKVLGNVYGGGNWGATGVNSSSNTSTTNIKVLKGTISGSVYGGGNNNGSGSSSKSSTVNVNVDDGTITGNVYGGSKALGTVYGNVNVRVDGGTIHSVYGGGEGGYTDGNNPGTFVTGNVNVTIGDNSKTTTPTITKVYGGSAYGTVNGSSNSTSISSTNTLVTVNKGTILDVYGGGEGNDNYTPYVLGKADTVINGGNITNVYGANDQKGKPNGTITVTVNNGTVQNCFGGGNLADITTSNVYLKGGTVTSAFGGGNLAAATTTNVHLQGSNCTNIFGGSNQSGDVTTSNISCTSGSSTNVYGGNNLGGVTSTSNVSINNATIGSVYGGGNEAVTGTTNVYLYGGNVTNTFGGGNKAGVTVKTNVTLNGGNSTYIYGGSNQLGDVAETNITTTNGTANTIYGGNNLGGVTTTSKIEVNGANIVTIYGGGNEAVTGTTLINLNTSTIQDVYGGGNKAGITTDTTVNLRGSTVNNLFGGSNQSGTVPKSNIDATSGTATTIYGGNNQGGTTTETNITIRGARVSNIFGGGNEADTTTSSIKVTSMTGTCQNIYGGGNKASVTTTNVEIRNNVNIDKVYGGSNQSGIVTTSNVTLPFTSPGPNIESVFGGNNRGGKTVNANVTINAGTVAHVYGGGNYAETDYATTRLDGATITYDVYGGGNQAAVNHNTNLRINAGNISGSVYGGGNLGIVGGNTTVNVIGARINKSLFAGGNGYTAVVYGNTLLNVSGSTNVTRHVFGGGNAAATGSQDNNDSTSTVNIVGLTCGGNVYGGANTSVLHGVTTVNIGKNAVTTSGLTSGNIHIGGTVFGGGEANESGSEIYDFSFISVTEGININIDASDHSTFLIDGSIFGSGNASSTSGYSYIDIKNYGTEANYKENVSIQRATRVTLNNSAILLTGATDRTNEYSDVLFSVSRVDELKLTNNSILYLENSTNLVKNFKSVKGVGNNEVKATATIDDNGNVTRNTNNKIFIYEGRNINIATNENVTAYGDVSGMTFFGMFIYDRDNKVDVGYFETTYNNNSTVNSNDLVLFTKGSYVLGKHLTNHNWEVDGFYSDFPNKSTTDKVNVRYIIPTPDDADYYMWVVGEPVTSYEITLTASKYSTLGTYELPLNSFYQPNTRFSILGFNYNDVDSDVNLIDKNTIPRVAASGHAADYNMGLVMSSSDSGWITIGKTSFLTNESYYTGSTTYLTENSSTVPTFLFYLYHSKNLETEGDMGTAVISLVAIVPIDDLNSEVKRINIIVNMNRAIYTTDDYEGTIAPGKKYEMFPPSAVNITADSSFSTYYSLFVQKNESIYKTGYHRSLASTYNLPVNTKITMIDLRTSGLPDYYYYIVNQADYNARATELTTRSEASYDLSKFIKMGSSNANNHYDDASRNAYYYDSSIHIAEEEFIFIFDFKETNIDTDAIEKSMIIELRDSDEEVIMGVIGVEQQQLFFNLYANKKSVIEIDAHLSTTEFYIGHEVGLNVKTNFVQKKSGNTPIIDTTFYDYRSGIKLSIIDSDNNVVNGPSIMGISYTLDGETYYPRFDGTVRINTSERIANINDNITINTEGSNLASGSYKLVIESFGSPDGIYYGLISSDREELSFTVLNTVYGLKANQTSDEELIVNKTSGKNETDTNAVTFNIEYSSGLSNPNIRISLYRRKYDEVYSTSYDLVDFKDVFSNDLASTNIDKVYMLFSTPESIMNTTLYTKENLTSGTYRVVFGLYDNNTYIGDVYRYIIVK